MARIAAVLAEHWHHATIQGPQCWCGAKMSRKDHDAHVAGVVAEALQPQIVTTQAELDALPFLSLIREIFGPSPSGADYGGVYERRRDTGWIALAGKYKDSRDNGAPQLPCRVLYSPEGQE